MTVIKDGKATPTPPCPAPATLPEDSEASGGTNNDDFVPPDIPVDFAPPDVGSMVFSRRVAIGSERRVKGSKKTKKKGAMRMPNSLPVVRIEPSVGMCFRYIRAGSGNNYTITVGDIARAIVSASSTNTYRYIMRTFRLQAVTLRGSVGAVGESCTVSLRYLGENTRELEHLDNTMKIDVNAMVHQRPPRFSLASFWHDVTSETLSTPLIELVYFGTGNFYVDLHMAYLIDMDRYVAFTLSGGSGLNTGGLYKGNLSGSLTNGLLPIGGERLGV